VDANDRADQQTNGENAMNDEQEFQEAPSADESTAAGPTAGESTPDESSTDESSANATSGQDDIGEELNRLAESFGQAVQAAWNSEQRHQLESDLNRGLRSLVDNVETILKQFHESEQGQELKEQAGKVAEKVRTSSVTAELKEGLTKGLQTVATEMQEFAQDLEKKNTGGDAAQDIPVEDADVGEA
jgi:hypothetical protein